MTATSMDDSRKMLRRVLDGDPGARPVAGPLAVHWCAGQAGVSVRDYTLDARVLADCVLRYHETCRPDAIWLSADTWVSAQAMGAAVRFAGPEQPLGGTGIPLVRSAADIDRIPEPDPAMQGRYPLMIEALRRIRADVGSRVFVVACFDQFPFSLACALMGVEAVMTSVIEDRPRVDALMHRCGDYAVAYASALAAAGADMLSGGDSPAGLIGPRLYREVAWPHERRVLDALRQRCSLPLSLHVCGNATPILRDMAATGADILELDHLTDLGTACAAVGPETAIWGNLDPVGLLARGSRNEVHAAALGAIRTTRAMGHHRFVLSSGCTLAMETPAANVLALNDACRGFVVPYPTSET